MTVLSDREIRSFVEDGVMDIDPFDEDRVQPASYDVVLDDEFLIPRSLNRLKPTPRTDLSEGIADYLMARVEDDSVTIPPNSFALGSTVARFRLPANMTLSVEPKSTGARSGLVTDGWGDPGWDGHITLELYNCSPYKMQVHAGESYCQFVFERTGMPAEEPYDGRYQGQSGVTPARQDE